MGETYTLSTRRPTIADLKQAMVSGECPNWNAAPGLYLTCGDGVAVPVTAEMLVRARLKAINRVYTPGLSIEEEKLETARITIDHLIQDQTHAK